MELYQEVALLISNIVLIFIFCCALLSVDGKRRDALNNMFINDEQSQYGPFHITYRHYHCQGVMWRVLILASLYLLIMRIHNVYILITA